MRAWLTLRIFVAAGYLPAAFRALCFTIVAGTVVCANAADVPVVHGSADIFDAPGIALAWAIQRGSTEAGTEVVIRMATDRARYPAATLVGVDPFTQARQPPVTAIAKGEWLELRVSRARFADFPRSELRLFASDPDAKADRPALIVYYVGVPDTTPEFTSAEKLDGYLGDRLRAVRR